MIDSWLSIGQKVGQYFFKAAERILSSLFEKQSKKLSRDCCAKESLLWLQLLVAIIYFKLHEEITMHSIYIVFTVKFKIHLKI